MKEYYRALRFGVLLLTSCLIAVISGVWLDEKLHCAPLFLLLLLAYAIIANFYLLVKGRGKHDI